MISVSGVTHKLGGSVILDDVSVDIPKGKVTALIGPNGAGKSTLMNLIARQADLQSGQISVDGMDITKTASKDIALKMSVVAQQVGVASRLRVRDLVSFGRWPQHQGRPTDQDKAAVQAALEEFDLSEISMRFADEISGGQRQRAFVAMAYAQDTDWLLLDEPLNNLDIRYAKSLMSHLRKMADKDGKSIVIVIHDLNYALSAADYFVGIKAGQVSFAGSTNEVVTPQALSNLFDTDVTLADMHGQRFAMHH